MTTNLNQTNFSDSDQQAVMAAIVTIRQKLPFLIALSNSQRRMLPKLGDKTRTFVEKAMEVATQNADFLPRSFDVEAMRRELRLFEGLYPILLSLTQLQELVADTHMVAGSEAYACARTVYHSAKANGKDAGINTVIDELGRRYSHKTRKTKGQTEAG